MLLCIFSALGYGRPRAEHESPSAEHECSGAEHEPSDSEFELSTAAPELPQSQAASSSTQTPTEKSHKALPSADELKKLPPDGRPDYNRLVFEKSPYLLQHATNPVDWFPWGDEAFAKARKEEKLVFLSIGYSTCHWCHVMERECFEDAEVAALLNKSFVAIKVDREERPDVDQLYMGATQAMTGSGGWPMTIVMTPDKQPFFAGTYFPKHGVHGTAGLMEILAYLADAWKTQHDTVLHESDKVVAAIRAQSAADAQGGPEALGASTLELAYQELAKSFDPEEGGFGSAPKFPIPHQLRFLLRYSQQAAGSPDHVNTQALGDANTPGDTHATGDARALERSHALEMVERTLEAMARGGIRDHIGFGFHRYSTDRQWLVPHFEKMLYDQASIALAYVEAYEVTHKDEYREVARETLEYVLRDMRSPEGGFYSAEDADSAGREGLFYSWTRAELESVLGKPDADLFAEAYGVPASSANATSTASSKSTGDGKSTATSTSNDNSASATNNSTSSANKVPAVSALASSDESSRSYLHLATTWPALAAKHDTTEADLRTRFQALRRQLFDAREKRVHPQKDDKILTDWNGLMIAALAHAARAFDDPAFAAAARASAEFVLAHLRDGEGRLYKRYRQGSAGLPAAVDDYAYFISGLIELYETTFDARWLEQAIALERRFSADFWDEKDGGYFFAPKFGDKEDPKNGGDGGPLFARTKEVYDGALPSGNSVAALDLLLLARITGDPQYSARAERIFKAFAKTVARQPSAFAQMMIALEFALAPSLEVVIAGSAGAPDGRAMVSALRAHFLPQAVVLFRPDVDDPPIARIAPFTKDMHSQGGKATAYVCRNFACEKPTEDIEALLRSIAVRSSAPAASSGEPAQLPASPKKTDKP